MPNIPIIAAFSAGLLAFLSPCVLPLVPVYLASVCGPEILEAGSRRERISIFFHSLSFVIGFSVVFITLGAAAGLGGFALRSAPIANKVGGSLLIAFGLFMLAALKFPWLNYEKRLTPSLGVTTGYLRSFLIGVIFSLAWTPCIAGLLWGTLSLALTSGGIWQGTYLLGTFSLGLGLPFLIIGIAFDSLAPLLKRIHRYSTWFYIVGGLLLITIGILILTNNLIWSATIAS
jgi:cytochrome c-type biogenesis protein